MAADGRLTDVPVLRLGRDAFHDVVDVLAAAFADYPVMRYILKDAGDEYPARLFDLVGFFTESRFARDYPVLGVRQGGRLVAAANVNPVRRVEPTPALRAAGARLAERIGEPAMARWRAFAVSGTPFEDPRPHVHLGMIGVHPECQGTGLARVVLDAVHGMSEHDPESAGVELTTELPRNLTLYERFGYAVTGHARVEELESWVLFRPDPA